MAIQVNGEQRPRLSEHLAVAAAARANAKFNRIHTSTKNRMTGKDKTEFLAPLFVTARNCDAVIGRPWRAMPELAERHNIENRSRCADAINEEQEAAALIRNLGYQMRSCPFWAA